MGREFLLEVGERAVKIVRGVGDIEFRVFEVREEMRKIPFQ